MSTSPSPAERADLARRAGDLTLESFHGGVETTIRGGSAVGSNRLLHHDVVELLR